MKQNASYSAAMCLLSAVIAVAAVGCRSGGFTPRTLPAEFQPPVVRDAAKIDLSALSRDNTPSELIRPGDKLDVTVTSGIEETPPQPMRVQVGEDGYIELPLIGDVPVAGYLPEQAAARIARAGVARQLFVKPVASVVLAERKRNRVTVLGAVEDPGTKELPAHQSDLVAALAAAGNLSKDAATKIKVRNPAFGGRSSAPPVAGPGVSSRSADLARTVSYDQPDPPARDDTWVTIDLEMASAHGGGRYVLRDGAVVMAPRQKPTAVHVIGLVREPDRFEIPPDEEVRLLDALAMAGGRTLQLADKVRVVRTAPGREEPVIIDVSVAEAKRSTQANLRLAPGDVVSVEETPLTFTIETLRSFIRFGFSAAIPGL